MATTLTPLAEGFAYLECPRWHDGRLWLSDFYAYRVLSLTGADDVRTEAEVSQQPSGLGWLPDGRLLVVSMRDRRILRRERDGTLVEHADLSALAPFHLNDMLVDDTGRAYVGDFGFDLMAGAPITPTGIIVVEPDGAARVAARDLLFPNGMVLSPDGADLVVAETFGQRLTALARGTDGTLGARRTWVAFGEAPSTTDVGEALSTASAGPDGIAAAGDGTIWVADALFHRLLHVAEGGTILEEISTGELGVYAVAVGGPDGRTLYACAAPSFAEHERRGTREGVLLVGEP